MVSLVRRNRRAKPWSNALASSGRPVNHGLSCSWPRPATTASVSAVAVDARSPGSKKLSSPNISPGPSTASSDSRPSTEVCPNVILPSRITYRRSPGSPSTNKMLPLVRLCSVSEARKAAAASGSRAVNIGACKNTSFMLTSTNLCCRPARLAQGAHCAVLGRVAATAGAPAE